MISLSRNGKLCKWWHNRKMKECIKKIESKKSLICYKFSTMLEGIQKLSVIKRKNANKMYKN